MVKKYWHLALLSLGICGPLFADPTSGMKGQQSWNVGIVAAPASQPVQVDGKLTEWNLDGQIWTGQHKSRDVFGVKTAAMWDKDYLYLSFVWKDPTPMHSAIDPVSRAEKGWVDDAIQLRVNAGDHCSWFTLWCYNKDVASMHIEYYKLPRDADGRFRILKSDPGKAELGDGAEMFYLADADGKGFVQEVKIPWKLLFGKPVEVKAHDKIKMGIEYIWGNDAGDWPLTRTIDNVSGWDIQSGFFWTNEKSWGEITFSDKPVKNTRSYHPDAQLAYGCVPIRAEIPTGAKKFTLVLEDHTGKRLRTIVGGFPVADAKVGSKEGKDIVEVMWDGLDDAGSPVQPGTYKIHGLTVGHVGAKYQMSYYNPGTPVWETADGKGGWGADHSRPEFVARAGDMIVLGTKAPEGGYGVWAVGLEGHKVWSEKRGAQMLTANDKHIYVLGGYYNVRRQEIFRLNPVDGSYDYFFKDGKQLPCPFPVEQIHGINDRKITAMAVSPDDRTLAVAVDDGSVLILNAQTLEPMHSLPLAVASFKPFGEMKERLFGSMYPIVRTPFVSDGKKLFYFNRTDNALVECNIDDGTLRPIQTEQSIEQPASIALDMHGNLLIPDTGKDMQVKRFSRYGKFLGAIGIQGGRPRQGTFDENGMLEMSAVAEDSHGNLWTTEYTEYPRRVSVWNKDGQYIRDYIGNTHYCGSGTFLHDQDAHRAYAGAVEIKLDYDNYTWRPVSVMWNPDPVKPGITFTIPSGSHSTGHVFRSNVSGKQREYYFSPEWAGTRRQVLFMNDNGNWRPVSAVGTASVLNAPQGEFAGLDPRDGFIWNDANSDGYVQRSECEIIPFASFGTFPNVSGWGQRVDPADLSFYMGCGRRKPEYWKFTPVSFRSDGAPLYAFKGMKKMGHHLMSEMADIVPVPGEDTTLLFDTIKQKMWLVAVDKNTGQFKWRYPDFYHGVHGSHNSPKGNPWGQLFGSLMVLGFAPDCGDGTTVFMIRGNRINDFLFTTDGLYVDKFFKDPLEGLMFPATAEEARSLDFENFVGGGEPFMGWFGRHSDGKVRMIHGQYALACHVLQVNGLDSIRRFTSSDFTYDMNMMAQAEQFNNELDTMRSQKPAPLMITMVQGGKPDFKKAKFITIAGPAVPAEARVAMMADNQQLYIQAQFSKDPSPWMNRGSEFTKLFKTGDCFDIQLGTDSKNRQRIVFAPFKGQNVAVCMRPVAPDAASSEKTLYESPVTSLSFDSVKMLDVSVNVVRSKDGCVLEAAIPWNVLGIDPSKFKDLQGDVGIILSDAQGLHNVARLYHFNKRTGLVNDLPNEAKLFPEAWGSFQIQ